MCGQLVACISAVTLTLVKPYVAVAVPMALLCLKPSNWVCLLQRPTLLKINRKDAPDSTSRLVLWTGSESRCRGQADVSNSTNGGVRSSSRSAIDASSHDAVNGNAATAAVSTFDSGHASQGASNSTRTSSQTANVTDQETSKAVCIAVFAQESGKVWGTASLALNDAMDDCLEAGNALVAIPSCEHQVAFSIKDANLVDAAARRLLC